MFLKLTPVAFVASIMLVAPARSAHAAPPSPAIPPSTVTMQIVYGEANENDGSRETFATLHVSADPQHKMVVFEGTNTGLLGNKATAMVVAGDCSQFMGGIVRRGIVPLSPDKVKITDGSGKPWAAPADHLRASVPYSVLNDPRRASLIVKTDDTTAPITSCGLLPNGF
jgi:hypothetical protein